MIGTIRSMQIAKLETCHISQHYALIHIIGRDRRGGSSQEIDQEPFPPPMDDYGVSFHNGVHLVAHFR